MSRIFTDLVIHNYQSNWSALLTSCGTDSRHQYGIFCGESQTSFSRKATRAGSKEGRLFSQASRTQSCHGLRNLSIPKSLSPSEECLWWIICRTPFYNILYPPEVCKQNFLVCLGCLECTLTVNTTELMFHVLSTERDDIQKMKTEIQTIIGKFNEGKDLTSFFNEVF